MPTNNFFPPNGRKRTRDEEAAAPNNVTPSSSTDSNPSNQGDRVTEKIRLLKAVQKAADQEGLDFLSRDFLSTEFLATPLAKAVLSDDSAKFAEQLPEAEKKDLRLWLKFACASGSQAVVKQLIEWIRMNDAIENKLPSWSFLPSKDNNDALYFAAAGGNKALCDWLVKHFQCRYNGETVLAIYFGGKENRERFKHEIREVFDDPTHIPSIRMGAPPGCKR